MSFSEAIKSVFSQYVGFSGRARRSEFWYFVLFSFIVGIVLSFIPVIAAIWSLATLLPCLALDVRRLHDIGKSGWFILLALIPIVGVIILLIWACKDSMPGSNEYGSNPKGK